MPLSMSSSSGQSLSTLSSLSIDAGCSSQEFLIEKTKTNSVLIERCIRILNSMFDVEVVTNIVRDEVSMSDRRERTSSVVETGNA